MSDNKLLEELIDAMSKVVQDAKAKQSSLDLMDCLAEVTARIFAAADADYETVYRHIVYLSASATTRAYDYAVEAGQEMDRENVDNAEAARVFVQVLKEKMEDAKNDRTVH